jgi:hypothetical protein
MRAIVRFTPLPGLEREQFLLAPLLVGENVSDNLLLVIITSQLKNQRLPFRSTP